MNALSKFIDQCWHQWQIAADETTTRARAMMRPAFGRNQPAQPLRLTGLEPRILFSATPIDPSMLPDADEVAMVATVEPVASEQSGPSLDSLAETIATDASVRELVIIDSSVPDIEQLLDDLHTSERNVEAFVLDADRDGLDQITEILNSRSEVGSIHIVSHAEDSAVKLGNVWLGEANLAGYSGQLAGWQAALASDADILFYGCDLAATADGQLLLESISALTGADVAASVDGTGHASYGSDWDLEYHVGSVETVVAFSGDIHDHWLGKLATITVDIFTDEDNGDSNTSLREAINLASAGDEIVLAAGTYNVTLGRLELDNDVTITGVDARSTIIDATGSGQRVFEVKNGSVAVISQMTIQGGNENNGGGIYVSDGTLYLSDAMLTNNTSNDGGAIHVHGEAHLDRVLLYNNTASGEGGGIHFHNADGGSLTNVTISGNSAVDGGGLYTDSDITIKNTTIAFNDASDSGGIVNDGGIVNISNTIVAGNTATNAHKDVRGGFNSDGSNLIQVVHTATGFGSDLTGVSANLFALGDRGGQTDTHALIAGSLAIDGGTAAGAASTDQRGVERVGSVDIGAYESATNILVVTNTSDLDNAADSSTVASLLADMGGADGISLREAINATNGTNGLDEIYFQITAPLSGGGEHLIYPGSALPEITDALIIDGTTDSDFVDAPIIRIDASFTFGAVDGLVLGTGSDGSTIRGLSITEFHNASSLAAIVIYSDNNLIAGNYIGVQGDGSTADGNRRGVNIIGGANNTIGGTAEADRNVISGNWLTGVKLTTVGATSNQVLGNYIGTDATGTAAVGNYFGIYVADGANDNLIGGTDPGSRNIISGNVDDGIQFFGNATSGNRVQGNYIGTDVSGSFALGNGGSGVRIEDAPSNTIGGTTAAERNIISGNAENGIHIVGNNARQNRIQGNYIGTNSDGTADIANGLDGVLIDDDGDVVNTGANDNMIGGLVAGAGNLISGNTDDGIQISGVFTIANSIYGNFIGSNAAGDATIGNGGDGIFVSDAPNTIIGATGSGNVIGGNVSNGIKIAGAGATDTTVQGNHIGTDSGQSVNLGNGADGIRIGDRDDNLNSIGNPVGGLIDTNVIAHQGSTGVRVKEGSAFTIRENRIYDNASDGIILVNGNLNRAAPLISAVTTDGGSSITITGSYDDATLGAETLTIEYFLNSTNVQQGETYLDTVTFSTLADGTGTINHAISANVAVGEYITATVTDSVGNTSQFSTAVEATGPSVEVTARETIDDDADGQIDYIKITTSENLNDDFSDLSISVAGYSLDATTPYVTDIDPGGANDNVFYVMLQESGTPDTGATPIVNVLANTMLNDFGGVRSVAADSAGVAATDTAGPVLVSATSSQTIGTTIFRNVGDQLDLVFSETLSGLPSEIDLESALAFAAGTIDIDNLPSIGTGVDPFSLVTNTQTNDTIRITLNSDNSVNVTGLTVGLNSVEVADGATLTDLAGNSANSAASALTIGGQLNDEPTLSATAINPTFTENDATPVTLFSGASASTVESGQTFSGLVLTVTNVSDGGNEILGADGSSFALTDGTGGTTATNGLSYGISVIGGTATISFTGGTLSETELQILVDGLTYQHNSENPSTSNRVVTLTEVKDSGGTGGGGDDTADLSIASMVTVIAVNDRPVLSDESPSLTDVLEDDYNSVGDSVAAIVVNGSITDVDGPATESIAITAVDNANGTWQYSTDNGGTWTNVDDGTLGVDHALLLDGTLVGGSTQKLRFVPAADFDGTATFTFAAWDMSSGSAGSYADTTLGTAFSDATDSASVGMVSVNDAPTLTAVSTNPTFTEDEAAAAMFADTSVDTVEANQTLTNLTLTVTNVSDGADEILGADGSAIALTNGNTGTTSKNGLTFNVTVASGTATVTFSAGALNETELETLVNTLTYQNDSHNPTTANRVVTLTALTDSGGGSDTVTLSIASTVTVNAANDAPTGISLDNLLVDENLAGGIIGNLAVTDADDGDTHAWSVSDSRFEIVGTQLKLKFDQSLDTETEPTVTLTITVVDQGGAGEDFDADFTITVKNVNEAPEADAEVYSVLADATLTRSAPGVLQGDFDPEGDAMTARLLVNVSHGTLILNADGSFIYTPNPGFVGTDTFTYEAWDGALSSADTEVTINVQPLPAGTPAPADPDPEPEPEPEPEPDPDESEDEEDSATIAGGSTSSGDGLGIALGGGTASEASGIDGPTELSTGETSSAGVAILETVPAGEVVTEIEFGRQPALSQGHGNRYRATDLQVQSGGGVDFAIMAQAGALWNELDEQLSQLNSQMQNDMIAIGAAGAAASSFTVGLVAWAMRVGFLGASGLLAQMPAWRAVDPLLVLQGFEGEDNESLEELMQRQSQSLDE